MKAMVSARKEYTDERRLEKAMVSAAEERRAAAEERRVAAEERMLALEEKISMVEYARVMAQEKELFLVDVMKCCQRRE
jgi:hypothetical protein